MSIDFDSLRQLSTEDKRSVIQFLSRELEHNVEPVQDGLTFTSNEIAEDEKFAREARMNPEQLLTQEEMWAEVDRLQAERRNAG